MFWVNSLVFHSVYVEKTWNGFTEKRCPADQFFTCTDFIELIRVTQAKNEKSTFWMIFKVFVTFSERNFLIEYSHCCKSLDWVKMSKARLMAKITFHSWYGTQSNSSIFSIMPQILFSSNFNQKLRKQSRKFP